MAHPIEPTPVLKGKALEQFCKSLKHSTYSPEKESLIRSAEEVHKKLNERRQSYPTVLKDR